MVSTFTPNIQLNEPARGDLVGTWDTAANPNYTLLDSCIGQITTISLSGSNVTLSAAQFQSKMLIFNSTLTASVFVIFPSSFIKSYEIQNLCTGTSAFIVQLQSTVSSGNVVCAPPGEIVDVVTDGINMKYKNLGRVGSYWDYAGSSVPAWVSGCSIPPYLNCDGSAFSSATYPILTTILGGTTLPDRRGTVGCTLNQGTGRTVNVINASSVGVIGGGDTVTLGASQIPTIAGSGTAALAVGNLFPFTAGTAGNLNAAIGGSGQNFPESNSAWTGANSMGATFTSSNTGGGSHGNVQPTTVYGLSLIRGG